MSEAKRAIWGFLKELGSVLMDLGTGAGNWGIEQAGRYLTFLRRAGFVFLILAGVLILALIVGVVTRHDSLIAGAGLLIGLATAALLLLATPLGAIATAIPEKVVQPVKVYLQFVGGILLWALLVTLYFSVVPISNNPKAIFLVILITFIVALFWAVYGFQPNARRIYASVISVFLITTISFFFPKTFAAAIGLRVRLDEKLAECLTSPLTCFSQQPLGREEVRSVELATQPPTAESGQISARPSTEVPRPTEIAVAVYSEPEGAEVYLDWVPMGRTPLRLEGRQIGGLLVLAKENYRAGFRRIDTREGDQVEFTLPSEGRRPRTRLILVSESPSGDDFTALRGRLAEEGFSVLGLEETREFQQEWSRAGGLSHRGFRAWARARFDTDLLVTARFHQSSRDLSEQELGFLGIREAVKGAVRAEVAVDLEVMDLRSGDHLAAVSGNGSSFALDRAQSYQKALRQAASESAKRLRQQLRGNSVGQPSLLSLRKKG